ncbi:MAG: hypothetical protein ACT4PL_09445, partial [Phycisphaerales bacterium]
MRNLFIVGCALLPLALAFAQEPGKPGTKPPGDGKSGLTIEENPDVPAAVREAAERAVLEKRSGFTQPPVESTPVPVRAPLPEIKDADVAAAFALLNGSFVSTLQGTGAVPEGVPPITLHMARVDITGLDNAAYFEVARADSPYAPFRQGILHVYKKEGVLRLRLMDF